MDEFHNEQEKIRFAVAKLIEEARKIAKEKRSPDIDETEELFGDLKRES